MTARRTYVRLTACKQRALAQRSQAESLKYKLPAGVALRYNSVKYRTSRSRGNPMKAAFRFAFLVLLTAASAALARADDKPLSRIAFGSCAEQHRPQPIWDAVVATRPELF